MFAYTLSCQQTVVLHLFYILETLIVAVNTIRGHKKTCEQLYSHVQLVRPLIKRNSHPLRPTVFGIKSLFSMK